MYTDIDQSAFKHRCLIDVHVVCSMKFRSLLEIMLVNFARETCRRLSNAPDRNVALKTATYLFSANADALQTAIRDLQVREEFVNEHEEGLLLAELESVMRRLRYEHAHWDDAIHGYRETEKANWNEANNTVVQRIRDIAFSGDTKQLRYVHVLDIKKDGYIKPHVDSVKFCGNTIAGLSLMSSSVMRLTHEADKAKTVDVLLNRRSLYIMKGDIRYKYTHEILPDDVSYFNGERIARDRRVSVMCRNEPEVVED